MLSARGAVGDRVLGLSAGADDYLPKPFSPAELVARVRTILRRAEGSPDDDQAAVYILADLVLDTARHRVTVGGREIALSSLELRLLQVLLEADGRVLSRDRLLDALYGHAEGDVSDRAIDVYVKRVREKLGDSPDAPRFIATVRGAGYRSAGQVERRDERRDERQVERRDERRDERQVERRDERPDESRRAPRGEPRVELP